MRAYSRSALPRPTAALILKHQFNLPLALFRQPVTRNFTTIYHAKHLPCCTIPTAVTVLGVILHESSGLPSYCLPFLSGAVPVVGYTADPTQNEAWYVVDSRCTACVLYMYVPMGSVCARTYYVCLLERSQEYVAHYKEGGVIDRGAANVLQSIFWHEFYKGGVPKLNFT